MAVESDDTVVVTARENSAVECHYVAVHPCRSCACRDSCSADRLQPSNSGTSSSTQRRSPGRPHSLISIAVCTALSVLASFHAGTSVASNLPGRPGSKNCDLQELLHNEMFMRANVSGASVPHSSYVNLSCVNGRSEPQQFLCTDGWLVPRPKMSCNFHCERRAIYFRHEDGRENSTVLPDQPALHQADDKTYHYACPHGFAHLSSNNSTRCILSRYGTSYWSPQPKCYFKNYRRCTVIGRRRPANRAGLPDYAHLHSDATGPWLLLGDIMTVRCSTRSDKFLRIRCSQQGWEALRTAGQNSTLDTLCEQPCPATLVRYDSGGPRSQYLVRYHTGQDSAQAFPENYTISYSCALGHRPQHPNSTCRFVPSRDRPGGKHHWKPPPICVQEEPCQLADLMASDYASAMWLDGSKRRAEVWCPDSYELHGSTNYTCAAGTWHAEKHEDENDEGVDERQVLEQTRETGKAAVGRLGAMRLSRPVCKWKHLKEHCAASQIGLALLKARNMQVTANASVNGPTVRVECFDGYRPSTGWQVMILRCSVDHSQLIIPESVSCQADQKMCANPFVDFDFEHDSIRSLSRERLVPAGRSVLFVCKNNSRMWVNATCTDRDGWVPLPQSLNCIYMCPRPQIQYRVDDDDVAFNTVKCWTGGCADSHSENTSLQYRCAGNYEAQHNLTKCVWSAASRRFVWSPQPACRLRNKPAYCRHEDIHHHAPRNGRCPSKEPKTSLHPIGKRIACACDPGTHANNRGFLYCQSATPNGVASWVPADGKALSCTKLGHKGDPCPHVRRVDCQQVFPKVIHLHNFQRTLSINHNNTRNFPVVTTVTSESNKERCTAVVFIYRLWVAYANNPGKLTAQVKRLPGQAAEKPGDTQLALSNCADGAAEQCVLGLLRGSTQLDLFDTLTHKELDKNGSSHDDVCLLLSVKAPSMAVMDVKLQWQYS